MFKKILICTDLSPASDALIQCVGELKALGLDEVVLAHVIYVANTPGLEEMLRNEAGPDMERQRTALEQQGLKVITEMPLGLPAHTLNDLSEKHNVSAILIGSHGRGIAKAAALGSVSSKLLQITNRPVLLNRIELMEGEKCRLACHKLFNHALFCTDFSDTAQRAFTYMEKIVESGCKLVTLLHVQDKNKLGAYQQNRLEEFNKIDMERLEMLKAKLMEKGAREVRIALPYGEPAGEIIKASKESDYSLIVMGSQGRGFIKEVFLGSVSNNVVRHASLPALLIPALR